MSLVGDEDIKIQALQLRVNTPHLIVTVYSSPGRTCSDCGYAGEVLVSFDL